jgi:dynein heavy chain
MVALRKKGMTERHWQQISAKVGFEVFPDAEFNFKKVIDIGLINYSDVCVEVG